MRTHALISAAILLVALGATAADAQTAGGDANVADAADFLIAMLDVPPVPLPTQEFSVRQVSGMGLEDVFLP